MEEAKCDKIYEIINSYINTEVRVASNDIDALEEIEKLANFIEKLNINATEDLILSIILANKKISNNLELIYFNFKTPFKSAITDLFIETYKCARNIESNNFDDLDFEDTAYHMYDLSETVLTFEEEQKLFKAYENKNRNIQEILIRRNIRLVYSIAIKYVKHKIPLEDLVQEGSLGLAEAIERFDYRKNYKFSGYAIWWIRKYIIRYINLNKHQMHVPIHFNEELLQFLKAEKKLGFKLNREPTVEEVGDYLNFSNEKIALLNSLRNSAVSLNKEVGDNEDTEVANFLLSKSDSLEKQMFNNNLTAEILKMFHDCNLNKRDIYVLIWHFGLGNRTKKTLDKIAIELNLTRERARQIEEKAIKKIRLSKNFRFFAELSDNPKAAIEMVENYKKEHKTVRKVRKNKTLLEIFIECSKEEIVAAVNSLKEEEVELLLKMFGEDYSINLLVILTAEEKEKYYSTILPKLHILLDNKRNRGLANCKLEELETNPIVIELTQQMAKNDALIVSLRLGYINSTVYGTKEISEYFNVSENYIRNIVKDYLQSLKKKEHNFIKTKEKRE